MTHATLNPNSWNVFFEGTLKALEIEGPSTQPFTALSPIVDQRFARCVGTFNGTLRGTFHGQVAAEKRAGSLLSGVSNFPLNLEREREREREWSRTESLGFVTLSRVFCEEPLPGRAPQRVRLGSNQVPHRAGNVPERTVVTSHTRNHNSSKAPGSDRVVRPVPPRRRTIRVSLDEKREEKNRKAPFDGSRRSACRFSKESRDSRCVAH